MSHRGCSCRLRWDERATAGQWDGRRCGVGRRLRGRRRDACRSAGGGSGGDEAGGTAGVSGGGAGSGGAPAFPPACLTDLTASFNLEGTCVYEADAQNRWSRACYSNAVRVEYEYVAAGTQCTPGDRTIARVYAPGGELCYTRVTTLGAGCESSSTSWSDAEGNVIATGAIPYPGTTMTVTCEGGVSSSCRQPCATEPSCDPGTCDVP